MTAWLTNWLASRLSPAERETVLGDAAERGTLPVRDLVSVLLWHEARAWRTAGPWIALLTLVLPLGFVLSVMSRAWANRFAIPLWIYVSNWTSEYVTNPGARLDLLNDFLVPSTLHVVCFVLWSWTVGRALRVLAGRAVGSSGVLLTVVIFAATAGTTTMAALNPADAVVFSSPFYRVALPFMARLLIVIVPLWCGLLGDDSAGWWWTVGRTAVTAILIGITFRWIASAVVFGWIPTSFWNRRPGDFAFWWVTQLRASRVLLASLLPFALAWPAAFLLIQARRRHARPA